MKQFYLLLRLGMLVGLLAGVARPGRAQTVVNAYTCQAQSSAFAYLAGGTVVPGLAGYYQTATVPLGFVFAASNKYFTTATVSSSGWLSLGDLRRNTALPNPLEFYGASEGDWLAAPLWADLSGTGGQCSYQTTGTAPNRVLTVEWRNWRWDQQATQASVSFQVRLYETSNRVEFAYQPEAGAVVASSARAQAVVGLNDSRGWVVVDHTGPAPAFVSYQVPGTTTRPPAGRLYSFVPRTAPVCPAPTYASLDLLRRTSARVAWSRPRVGGTLVGVHYGPRGFVAGSAADRLAPAYPADTATLTNLALNTNYEFYVEYDCGIGTPGRSPRVGFSTYFTPSNDDGYRAQLLPLVTTNNQSTSGSTFEATPSLPGGLCNTSGGVVRDVWYRFVATAPQHRLSIMGTAASLEVRTGYGANSVALGCATSLLTYNNYTYVPLTVSNLTVGQTYFARVYTQSAGTAGGSFRLALQAPGPAPANDLCAQPALLPAGQPYGSAPLSGTLRDATPTGGLSFNCGPTAAPDVWYSFVAAPNQEVYFKPTFDAWGELYETGCGNLLPPSGQGETCFRAQANEPVRFQPTILVSGTRYLLRIVRLSDNTQAAVENFELALTRAASRPANDLCANAPLLALNAPAVAGSIGAARPTAGLAPASGCAGAATPPATDRPDVWYRFVAPATPVALTLASNFAAQLEVRPGTCASVGSSLACAGARPAFNSGVFGALPGQVQLTALTAGTTYLARVLSLQADTLAGREFTLSLTDVPARPLNDEPGDAISLPLSAQVAPVQPVVTGSLVGATATFAGSVPDVWYKLVVPTEPAGLRLVQTSGLDVHLCEGPPYYTVRVGLGGQAGVRSHPNIIPLSAAAGQTMYVRVMPATGQPAPYPSVSLALAPLPPNDEPCGALPLPVSAAGGCLQPVHGTTLGATFNAAVAQLNPANNCLFVGTNPPDVWYRFQTPTGALTLRCDDDMVGLLRVFEQSATCADDLRMVGCQAVNNGAGRPVGTAWFDGLVPGRDYLLAVSAFDPADFYANEFTLCAEVGTALPTRPAAAAGELGLWPNPVAAGQLLQVQVPVTATAVRAEWLSALGQRVAADLPPVPVANGRAQLPTAGRVPGVYLLRLWLADGQPPLVRRVLVQ